MGARDAVRLKAIRRQMRWSRKDLARLLGVSVACIGRVERGVQELISCKKVEKNGKKI